MRQAFALCALLALTATCHAETASDRAWTRASRIADQVHDLTHRVHEYLPNDIGWTEEDSATCSATTNLKAALRKLGIDVTMASTRHLEAHPQALRISDTETTRLRLIDALCSTLTAQLDVIYLATIDKPDSGWRELLPPACALTETVLKRWRETGHSGMSQGPPHCGQGSLGPQRAPVLGAQR
jgi:hypothetical protein